MPVCASSRVRTCTAGASVWVRAYMCVCIHVPCSRYGFSGTCSLTPTPRRHGLTEVSHPAYWHGCVFQLEEWLGAGRPQCGRRPQCAGRLQVLACSAAAVCARCAGGPRAPGIHYLQHRALPGIPVLYGEQNETVLGQAWLALIHFEALAVKCWFMIIMNNNVTIVIITLLLLWRKGRKKMTSLLLVVLLLLIMMITVVTGLFFFNIQ